MTLWKIHLIILILISLKIKNGRIAKIIFADVEKFSPNNETESAVKNIDICKYGIMAGALKKIIDGMSLIMVNIVIHYQLHNLA